MNDQSIEKTIKYICAPMDGVTDYIFRQCQARHFTPADEYFTPFLSLTCGHGFQKREHSEMDPDNNRGLNVIPQIIGNDPEDFLWGVRELADLGYREININMGCPSKVVVRKHKGAGMLSDHDLIRRTLGKIFESGPRDVRISVKTRIGVHDSSEFPAILDIFNEFPISRLIVHPRVSDRFYSGSIDAKSWNYAVQYSRCPLCFNGDVSSWEDIRRITGIAASEEDIRRITGVSSTGEYPTPVCTEIMLGRALVSNPALIGELKGCGVYAPARFMEFHNDILERQYDRLGSESHTLKRMKEYWYYWACLFKNAEPVIKQIRQSQTIEAYITSVGRLI